MGDFFYQIAIKCLVVYFKLGAFSGNKKAKEAISGRKKWKEPIQNLENNKSTYWIHAASHGEGLMAIPLIEKILENINTQIIISFFSPSGYQNFNYQNKALIKIYLPFDTLKNSNEIVKLINIKHLIFVKYDLWMNLIKICHSNNIPVSVFSSKFEAKQWYFKVYGGWARKRLSQLSNIFTIDIESKLFLESIGFENLTLSGDSRYDQVNNELKPSALKINKPCLILGSSWEAEEKIISNIFYEINELQIIIAPHEVNSQRLNQIQLLFGENCKLYSKINFEDELPKIIIIDQIGLLADLYSISDMAFIGGGFSGKLHNIIEPAAKGNVIFFGPNFKKFPEANEMINQSIAYSINSHLDIIEIIKKTTNEKEALTVAKQKSIDFVINKKGATEIIYRKIVQEK